MKKSSSLLVICLLLFCQSFLAQNLDLKWSDRMEYENRKEGFMYGFLNTNDKYIYTLNMNYALKEKKKNKKIKISYFDKITMKKIGDIALKGYKENTESKELYATLNYFYTVVLNNDIYVFWIKKSTDKEELYVETFNANLKRLKKIKKIYTSTFSEEVKKSRFSNTSITIQSNKNVGNNILIGSELPQKDDNTIFKYIIINPNLEIVSEKDVTLAFKLGARKSKGITSKYQYGDDGNLYISTNVSLSLEEMKEAKKGQDLSYSIFSIVDLDDGSSTVFELKAEDKNINDFKYVITKDKIKIYGFFVDLAKDPTGRSTHGVFFNEINTKMMESTGLKYTYFTKTLLDQLFKNDEGDKKKTKAIGKKNKEKAKENDAQSLDNHFVIESMTSVDENNIVLFCSKMNNWYIETCQTNTQTHQTTCTKKYYCDKSNVTALRVSSEGEIIWASNLDRFYTYSGTSISDLKVTFSNNLFYVIYSNYNSKAREEDNASKKKNTSEYKNGFDYATFDYETGKYSENIFYVNKKGDEEKMAVNPLNIVVMDGKFYVNYMKISQNWLKTIPTCAAGLVCFPLGYYALISGDFKKGYGNLGVITPIEGKVKK